MPHVTRGALGRLGDATPVDRHLICIAADAALEERDLEIGYYGGGTNDHPTQAKEGVDRVRIEGPHVRQSAEVKRSDLHAREDVVR